MTLKKKTTQNYAYIIYKSSKTEVIIIRKSKGTIRSLLGDGYIICFQYNTPFAVDNYTYT